MQKFVTDIKAGNHLYIIDDIDELYDVLEFYPIEEAINAQMIVGKLALILATPDLLSEKWDGCVLLSFEGANDHLKLPIAALDMYRTYCESEEVKGEDQNISGYSNKDNRISKPTETALSSEFDYCPKNLWNNILPPSSSSSALKEIFFDQSESPILLEREIVYIRDSSSEAAMIRQLAAESIQDAYR